MIESVTRKKSNLYAIRQTVKRETGTNIDIFEPWTKMFFLSQSKLSGDCRMPDGKKWCYHTAQAIIPAGSDIAKINAIIERDRPAGTLFLTPEILP